MARARTIHWPAYEQEPERTGIGFWCPGCKTTHIYDERWKFNGNYEKPSFTPSLRITTGHYVQGIRLRDDGKCGMCESAKERGVPTYCSVCHLYATDGKLHFCADCTHELAGKLNIPMVVHDGT